jgi:hypothetical protein
MDSFLFKILKKLNDAGVSNEVDVTDIILGEYPSVDKRNFDDVRRAGNRISLIIKELRDNEDINSFQEPSIGNGNASNGYTWYDTTRLKLRITNKGSDRINAELSKGEGQRLQESMIVSNESVRKTNEATIINYDTQRKLGNRSLILAGVSAVFIIFSVYQAYSDKTAQELKGIKEELKTLSKEVQKIQPSLEKAILSKTVYSHDTVYVKK